MLPTRELKTLFPLLILSKMAMVCADDLKTWLELKDNRSAHSVLASSPSSVGWTCGRRFHSGHFHIPRKEKYVLINKPFNRLQMSSIMGSLTLLSLCRLKGVGCQKVKDEIVPEISPQLGKLSVSLYKAWASCFFYVPLTSTNKAIKT